MSKARWVIGLVLTVAALHASPTFDFHLTGLDGNGDAVSGDAIFTILDTHHFSVTVTNTSSMQDLEQVIEGLEFTLTADGVVLLTSSGDFVIIDSNGTVRTLLSGATGWGLQASGSGWLVCAQCGATDAADLVGAGPYSSLFSGSYLDSATFDFSTNSALPTDGTDPFSNVWLVFGSGESTGQTSIVGNNNGGTNGGTNNGASDDPPVGGDPNSPNLNLNLGGLNLNLGGPGPGTPGAPGTPGGGNAQPPSTLSLNATVLTPEPAAFIPVATLISLILLRRRLSAMM